MTSYVILDSTANLVDSFDNEPEARAALEKIARQDPSTAEEYALLAYDDHGRPLGKAVLAAEFVHA
jgi:hypothetical protein